MRKILLAFLVAALALSVSVSAASAQPGKPMTPPDLKKVVLIHYAQPKNPGRPFDVPPGKQKDKDEDKVNDYYELLGPKWNLSEGSISYVIDTDGAPSRAVDAISSAFEAWDDATSAELFNDTYVINDEAVPSLDYPDFDNVVCWRGIAPPSVIAVTTYWYYDNDGSDDPSAGDEMVDADIIFNALLKWSIGPSKKAYHVQNIATHEAGHVVGLADLYDEVYTELTMYGYSKKGETKKVSLEEGDILGTEALYGE